jgi:hypothetical protein
MGHASISLKMLARIALREIDRMLPLSTHLFSHRSIPLRRCPTEPEKSAALQHLDNLPLQRLGAALQRLIQEVTLSLALLHIGTVSGPLNLQSNILFFPTQFPATEIVSSKLPFEKHRPKSRRVLPN